MSTTPPRHHGDAAETSPPAEQVDRRAAASLHASDAARRLTGERDAAEASRDRFAFLAEVSRRLAQSIEYESTLTTVAGMSLRYLGAWCIVDVCNVDGSIRRLAVLHPDPAKQLLARALHERYPPRMDDRIGAPRVIRTRQPEVVVGVSDEALIATARDPEHLQLLRELGTGAYVIVPMVARDHTIGAITFVTAESGRQFGATDVILATDLATRAAMAVDNARLYAEALAARVAAAAAQANAEAAQGIAEDAQAAATAAQMRAEVALAEAEAASRAKSEFLAMMSHELRTPLSAISGYVELIERGMRGPVTPEQHAALAHIQRSERHLAGLLTRVMDYARLAAGAVTYAMQEVAVDVVLAGCHALLAPRAAAKHMVLTHGGCDPALKVRADPEKLQEIVLNLLTNAVKYTDAGGEIVLDATPRIGAIDITVRDTGHGIAAEQLERIFEPFVQVDPRPAQPREGVGLGLAISRDLARGMGGDLTVESAPGVGSTFTLSLPRS